jgi:hypothetical protein
VIDDVAHRSILAPLRLEGQADTDKIPIPPSLLSKQRLRVCVCGGGGGGGGAPPPPTMFKSRSELIPSSHQDTNILKSTIPYKRVRS